MKKVLCVAMVLSLSAPAMAGDWTPYLQKMKDSCNVASLPFDSDYEEILVNKLPKAIKGDVQLSEDGDISLKNATAFGYPLAKIVSGPFGYRERIYLGFNTTKIAALAPQFYFKDSKGKVVRAGDTSKIYFAKTNNRTQTIVKEVPYPAHLKNSDETAVLDYAKKQYGKKAEYKKLDLLFATKTGWSYYYGDGEDYVQSFGIDGNTLSCGEGTAGDGWGL